MTLLNLSGSSADYFQLSGTSMASPVVAGAAALMLQANPNLSPDTIKARLMLSADKWYAPDGTQDPLTYGAGYLNIPSALAATAVAQGAGRQPRAPRERRRHPVGGPEPGDVGFEPVGNGRHRPAGHVGQPGDVGFLRRGHDPRHVGQQHHVYRQPGDVGFHRPVGQSGDVGQQRVGRPGHVGQCQR